MTRVSAVCYAPLALLAALSVLASSGVAAQPAYAVPVSESDCHISSSLASEIIRALANRDPANFTRVCLTGANRYAPEQRVHSRTRYGINNCFFVIPRVLWNIRVSFPSWIPPPNLHHTDRGQKRSKLMRSRAAAGMGTQHPRKQASCVYMECVSSACDHMEQ
jgi:hypothetical protein